MLDTSRLWRYQNSPDVCGWCGEEQANDQLLCLEQIWMCAAGSSLVFQWYGYSGNSLNGAAIPEIPPRVRLHLAPPEVASPQGKSSSRLHLSSRLMEAVLLKKSSSRLHLPLPDSCGCSPQKILLKAASPTSRFMQLLSSNGAPLTRSHSLFFFPSPSPFLNLPLSSHQWWKTPSAKFPSLPWSFFLSLYAKIFSFFSGAAALPSRESFPPQWSRWLYQYGKNPSPV